MATYTDNFNRANANLSASADWEAIYNEVELDTNELNPDGSSTSYARWIGGGTWGRTQECQVEIGTLAGSTSAGPAVYMTASGGYALRHRPDNGAAQLVILDNAGNDTWIGAGENIGVTSTGDVLKIRAEDDGSGDTLLTAYLNGVSQFTRTDSTYTSGNPGVYLDGFTQTSLDNWQAEDFQASASATVTATVTDASTGSTLANETGIDWHWSDTFNGDPTDTGTGETTDGSGVLTVDLSNTGLSSGQAGYLTIKLSNGDVGVARETLD